jgi:hypothetical protein
MRFQGNVVHNLLAAQKAQDEQLAKDILVDEMANIIETNPKEMVKVLRYSNVNVSDTASQRKLVELASYNFYNNPLFQKNLAVNIVKKSSAQPSDYASAVGAGAVGAAQTAAGATGGAAAGGATGGWGSVVGAVGDLFKSISGYGRSKNELKSEEERTKLLMYEKIFGQQQQRNWLPIIVIGGVLLIGAIVVFRTTGKNK